MEIIIKPIEHYEVEIPVADFDTRQALADALREQARAGYLIRAYSITEAVVCEAALRIDAQGAIEFATAFLKARAA